MQLHSITTPFGRRPAKLSLVRRQLNATEIRKGKAVDKWKVFRDVCEARQLVGLQDRALSVLNALLTFYPDTELSETRGLIVFPSNAQLTIRSHGVSGATLRRALASLVDAGVIIRHDSPNGKRYAHRDRAGEIEKAFGFDLSPLLQRAEELAHLAQQVAEENLRFKRAREALTLCRRDVRKLMTAAMEEGADGDWTAIEALYLALVARLPRNADRIQVEAILDEMSMLRTEIINLLELQIKTENMNANDAPCERHIQNSNTESIHEFEPRFEQKQGSAAQPEQNPMEMPIGNAVNEDEREHGAGRHAAQPPQAIKALPLGMVLRACPQISDYGPGGGIASWRDLMAAAVVVRSMLGVSPSAYQQACEAMGPESAAITMACILERAGHINSAGGYLRDLTAKAARGEFSLGPVIMALMRANAGGGRKSA